MTGHVAVGIVGYRNADDIVRCLAALDQSTHVDFEVVVCENGGPEAFEALTSRLPRSLKGGQTVRVILAPGNLGFAGGVNVCLAASPDADAWWVLNPDTEPHPDALAQMAARLDRGDCEAVGCTLYLLDGRIQACGGRWQGWLARAVSLGYGRRVEGFVDATAVERAQNYLLGASMLVNRRFIAAVGPMREEYFLYCEETEWCLRGLARGMRLGFAPRALVLHASGATTGAGKAVRQRPRLPIYLGERNKLLLTRDCFPNRLFPAAIGALAVIAWRYARRGAWTQFGYAMAGWWAGLGDERGPPDWLET